MSFLRIEFIYDGEILKMRFKILNNFIQIRMVKNVPIPVHDELVYFVNLKQVFSTFK